MNYFLDDKINKAEILFPGVGCFLIAVFLGSAVHSSNASDNKAKLNNYSNDYKEAAMYVLFATDNIVYIERWIVVKFTVNAPYWFSIIIIILIILSTCF